MNERIQELAYLAEDYADSIVDQGGEFHTTYTEKLAELIVRECAEVSKNYAGGSMPVSIASAIKQHFGVVK